jgi:hypothetical protein
MPLPAFKPPFTVTDMASGAFHGAWMVAKSLWWLVALIILAYVIQSWLSKPRSTRRR